MSRRSGLLKKACPASLIMAVLLMACGCAGGGSGDKTGERIVAESGKETGASAPITQQMTDQQPSTDTRKVAEKEPAPQITETDWSEYFEGLNGAAVVYDASAMQYRIYNREAAQTRRSPCSTFKIISSLTALEKGIIELVRAFDCLKDAANCRLLLVGMFEERDALPKDVQEHIKNDKRIIFTGFINGGMEYYYSLMDVYVLPSYREGFPTGVLEAQAMEKPVVTTRVTGCCDSIIEGKTGLFSKNEVEDLAEKIDTIRLEHVIDGREGRKWVMENFNSPLIWKEIEKLYL